MQTRERNATERVLRDAFRTIDSHTAQVIREAYYKAVEGLIVLSETLERAALQVGEQNDHALINEHLIAVQAMDTMRQSLLGRIL